MNLKILSRLEQASSLLMNYLAVFCLQTAVFAALDHMLQTAGGELPAPHGIRQILLVLLPFALWGVREKADHLLLFLGAHLGLLVLFPALSGETNIQRGVFALFTAGYVAGSFFLRFRKEEETPVREDSSVRRKSLWDEDGGEEPAAEEIRPEKRSQAMPSAGPNMLLDLPAAIGSFLLCAGLGENICCRRIWYAALLFALLLFVNIYLRNLERFIRFNQAGNARIPVRRMIRQGGGMTAGFGALTVLALGACTNGSLLMGLAERMKAMGLWLLRGLFFLLSFLMSLSKGSEEGPMEQLPSERQVFEAMEAAEQSLLAKILEKVVSFLVLAFLCALAAWLLYKLVLFVISRFYEKKKQEESDLEAAEEIRERLEKGGRGSRRERGLPLFAGTPEERIRRSFVRSIRHTAYFRRPDREGRRRKPWESGSREEWERNTRGLTARQLGELTGLGEEGEREASEELIRLYEKARYGRACTKDEAKRAEQTAGRLLRR